MRIHPARIAALTGLIAACALGGWLPEKRLSESDLSDFTAPNNAKAVAIDRSGDVHVVWSGDASGIRQVWYSRWDTGSRQWSGDTVISQEADDALNAAVAVDDSDNVHVVWQVGANADAVRYRERLGTTGAWAAVETVAAGAMTGHPSVAARGSSMVAVAYEQQVPGRAVDVFLRVRDAGYWRTPTQVSAESPRGSYFSSVGVDSMGNVSLAWLDMLGPTVCFRESTTAGWWAIETTYSGNNCAGPCLSVQQDGTQHLAFRRGEQSANNRLIYRRRTAGTWGDTVPLPVPVRVQHLPSLSVDQAGRLHVVWCAESSSVKRVYYAESDSSGINWAAPLALVQTVTGLENPSICARSEAMQVVWTDYRNSSTHPDVYARRFELVHDVGVARIESPTGEVDSGAFVHPSAVIGNCGEFVERGVPVLFELGDTVLDATVDSLGIGDSALVSFDSCLALARGWNTVSCSVAVAGDIDSLNNAASDSFFVRVRDVAATQIVAPDSVVNAGTLVPRVRLRNHGNVTATATAWFAIEDDSVLYRDSVVVLLPAARESVVSFTRHWPTVVGQYTARCSLGTGPDMHPENDTLSKGFRVSYIDVGTSRVVWPTGTVDSAASGTPRAVVRNLGSEPVGLPVVFRIGDGYRDTTQVASLAPGDSVEVAFDTWTALARSLQAVGCSTMLDDDRTPGNDAQRCSVFVRVCDVAAKGVVRPVEIISRGEIRPAVELINHGNTRDSFGCRFEILLDSAVYRDSILVAVEPEDTAVVEFAPWWAQPGVYTGRCSTCAIGDMRPENDTAARSFQVVSVDAALREITFPVGRIVEGRIEPQVRVANLGDEAVGFPVIFASLDSAGFRAYCETTAVAGLAPMAETVVTFPEWNASHGRYSLVATTALPGDSNPANDTVRAELTVDSLESRYWTQLAPMPRGPRDRPVRGGALVAAGSSLFALKGANTAEWYGYDPAGDSWQPLAPIPADSHRVRSGAALCWDGAGSIFALKGNHTREFLAYDVASDAWSDRAGLPPYSVPAKFGSGLVFLSDGDTGKVLLVKGGGTRDLLVYWVGQDEWHARRPVPYGPDSTRPKYGTSLTLVGRRVFCLKGRTCEFYEYFPDGDSWRERARLPEWAGPNRKRTGKGAALASDGERFVYAFKGGRTREFWRYDIRGDTWARLDDLPFGPGLRRLGDGAALAWLDGRVYALKGNSTRELWRFNPDAGFAPVPRTGREGTAAEAVDGSWRLVVSPGPVAGGFVTIAFTAPGSAPVRLELIDAVGRVLHSSFATRHSRVTVDLRSVPSGVYLLRLASDDFSAVRRLVVLPQPASKR